MGSILLSQVILAGKSASSNPEAKWQESGSSMKDHKLLISRSGGREQWQSARPSRNSRLRSTQRWRKNKRLIHEHNCRSAAFRLRLGPQEILKIIEDFPLLECTFAPPPPPNNSVHRQELDNVAAKLVTWISI